MWKKINIIMFSCFVALNFNVCSYAEEYEEEELIEETEIVSDSDSDVQMADKISSQALNDYDASGSLFEKITLLEQEKIVVQLEKERAQLDLELDRLNAERIKLQMELDTLSGRAEQQQQELEAAKTQLEIQTEKLRQQKISAETSAGDEPVVTKSRQQNEETSFNKKYKLINVFGVDNQLQATIEDLSSGQNKRIAVGKDVDGYIVKSISLNDGIVFEKDGNQESLNIGK